MTQAQRSTLWVVDDVPLELEATRRALEGPFDVVPFGDGASVVERAASGPLPDAIILDWHMEDTSGLDVLRFLRSQEPTVALPVLVFTATGDREDLLDALSNGADDYVGKGASVEELKARVQTLLRAKELRVRAERAEAELAVLLLRERQAREEAELANRAKDLFLATVSHELRNPLSAMLGWARMIKSGKLEPTQIARAIDTIERNAVAQARIVDDLFDVARIVAGKLRIDQAVVDLARVVEHAIETARPAAAEKELALVVDLASCAVWGDQPRLQQVALNLVSNAVKFTPVGGRVVVTVRQEGDRAVLQVADTGPGMPPALLPRVFDRFQQGDGSIGRAHGGLGLGLAIVRQLVDAHGGTVTARNGVGGGAVFEVDLPALPLDALAGAGPEPVAGPRLGGATFLVVEDDPDGRALLVALLASRGARVIEAASAEEALARIADQPPTAVISAVRAPGRGHHWLIREVRRIHGEHPPVIAITAGVRETDRAHALAAGAVAHFGKPIDTEELMKAVTSLPGLRR